MVHGSDILTYSHTHTYICFYMHTQVHIPGAVKLSISFDPQSRTETGCDYLVFYKDRSRTERWGQEKYSGMYV